MRGRVGWLPLGGRDEDLPVKGNQKPDDSYRVLVHDQRRSPTARPCTTSCEPTD